MKPGNDELSRDQKAYFHRVLKDPVLFAEYFLDVKLWVREVEILRSIQKHSRTAIKACHGVGKTFALAVASLWWLTRYD
jgi:phage terminase large subunit